MSKKSKVAQNLIPSNFASIGDVDPTHCLGGRDDSTQIGPAPVAGPPVTPSLIKLAQGQLKIYF